MSDAGSNPGSNSRMKNPGMSSPGSNNPGTNNPAMNSLGDRRSCEFHLLRYVPDAGRNEFVHIGVILREQGSREAARVMFTRDWRRVRCLDPDADTALLEGMESELRKRFQAEPEGNLMRLLGDSLSLSVQMTEAKAYLAES